MKGIPKAANGRSILRNDVSSDATDDSHRAAGAFLFGLETLSVVRATCTCLA